MEQFWGMISERIYWMSLIGSMGTLIIITIGVVLVMPAYLDYGIDIITNAGFTIFTILFLTWIVRIRENGAWKIVEDEVLARISRHLGDVLREIHINFLDDTLTFHLSYVFYDAPSILGEVYAGVDRVKLGKMWEALLQKPFDVMHGRINRSVDNFQRQRDFLEHIMAEYSRFMKPKLVQSIMIIENELDGIIRDLQIFIASVQHKSYAEEHMRKQVIVTTENSLTFHFSRVIRMLRVVEQFVMLDTEVVDEDLARIRKISDEAIQKFLREHKKDEEDYPLE